MESVWSDLGQGGAFMSEYALTRELHRRGFSGIPTTHIQAFVKHKRSGDIKRAKDLPRHVSTRKTILTRRNYLWHCDSTYKTGGVGAGAGPWRYFILCVDGFSKKFFARPLVKLTAGGAAAAFTDIMQEENGGVYPENLVTDRGSEYLKEFHALVVSRGVDHVLTHPQQVNKAYFAERGIRTVKGLLKRAGGSRKMFSEVLRGVISTYNNSVTRVLGMTPNDAHTPEREGEVLEMLDRGKHSRDKGRFGRALARLVEKFSKGDRVKVRIPHVPFEKETDVKFYPGVYVISEVVQSTPLPSYRVVGSGDGFSLDEGLPGTFQYKSLRKV